MIQTYLRPEEKEKMKSVGDKEIDELLKEVNEIFADRYFISEQSRTEKPFLRKKRVLWYYSLYAQLLPDGMEVININFCQDHDCSINTLVKKSYIVTYLLGMLSGWEQSKNQPLS